MSKRLEMLDQLVARGTTDPFVYYARAMELKSLARPDEALAQLCEIHERFPTYVPAWHQAGILCRERGDRQSAARLFERGVQQARSSGNAHAAAEMSAELDALAESEA